MNEGRELRPLQVAQTRLVSDLTIPMGNAGFNVFNCSLFQPGTQRDIVAVFTAWLWGEAKPCETFEYPRDWVQAFKQRWFPAWAKDRWPVKMALIEVEFWVYYPGFKPANDPFAIETRSRDLNWEVDDLA